MSHHNSTYRILVSFVIGCAMHGCSFETSTSETFNFDLEKRENHLELSPDVKTLEDTGFFEASDGAVDGTISNELMYFAPQYPLWSDGLKKRRWIRLPAGAVIDSSNLGTIDRWVFPVGTKLWKEFALEATSGAEQVKVEMRYMEKLTDGRWAYATFLWDSDQKKTFRANNTFNIRNYVSINDQVKHDIPSHNNCVFCHTTGSEPVLGFSALQLSDDRDSMAPHAEDVKVGTTTLASLVAKGLLTEAPATAPKIVAKTDVEKTALGYLHGNCSSCHSPMGRAKQYSMDFVYRLADADAGKQQELLRRIYDPLIDTVSQEYKLPNTRWPDVNYSVFPGDPDRSHLIQRMKVKGHRHAMPKVGSKIVDQVAVDLLSKWILELDASPEHEVRARTGQTVHPE